MARLIANRSFRYASRELSADEEFEADSKDVLVLTRANNPLARSPSSVSDTDQNKKPRRYNRRDMRAED